MTGINDMCDDVLLLIFLYLEGNDLVRCGTQVCSHWNNLIHHSYLWKNKWIICNIYDSSCSPDLNIVLELAPVIQCLEITCETPLQNMHKPILSKLMQGTSNLLKLKLKLRLHGDNEIIDLINPSLQYLEVIFLEDNDYKRIGKFNELQALLLNDAYNFCGRHLRIITEKCTYLKQFSSLSRNIREADVVHFLIHRKENLQILHLSGYGLSNNAFLLIALCNEIEELEIHDARLMSLEALIQIVVLPKLKRLFIKRLKMANNELLSVKTTMCMQHILNIHLESEDGKVFKF